MRMRPRKYGILNRSIARGVTYALRNKGGRKGGGGSGSGCSTFIVVMLISVLLILFKMIL